MKNKYTLPSKAIVLTMAFVMVFSMSFAQKTNLWSSASEDNLSQKTLVYIQDQPIEYLQYELKLEALKSRLEAAPNRREASFTQGVIVDFPNSDGTVEQYRVVEASVMQEALQNQHPELRSYKGQSITNPYNTVRFSITPFGLRSIKMSPDGVDYIEPATTDKTVYSVYSRASVPFVPFECGVEDEDIIDISRAEDTGTFQRNADDGQLRTFALALGCTEEYAAFQVAQAGLAEDAPEAERKAAVLANMVDVMTRVNALYERELSLTMELVSNNENVIFLSSPFLSNSNYSALINESQQFIDAFIGQPYDIGHMLTTGPGGLAFLNSPCTSIRAGAVSGTGAPIGSAFEGILMHEMGHQYGSPHTWNGSEGSCNPSNVSTSSAYEPGSGTTIMGYAGICGSQNIQTFRDLYFHQRSLQTMWNNISFGNSTCATQTASGNSAPSVDAGANYNIPIRTPYKLTATATDADGTESLTYCWEQYDLGPQGVPGETTMEGPLVRSFPPTSSPVRYIPRLEDVVANGGNSTQWEKLVLIERAINFRVTVRDNDPNGGNNDFDAMTINTVLSGFFRVTSQNAPGTVYDGNSTQTVTWDVAGTTENGINTSEVNILLSTDAGVTFDTVLAASVANDGSHDVVMPNVDAENCRIIVESVGNIFYNINLIPFELQAGLSVEDELLSNLSIYPNPNTGDFTIDFRPNTVNDIKIDLYDIRGRKVFSKDYEITSQFNENISVQNAMSGIYILRISDGIRSVERKLIIR
ncbi:M12 family metallo-peptidase [Ichthyenterobacterium sp. W332]|uniref:M12 family metallo-peptidase n=1 Tax=Microcosmobacter mediterraneus TaxID=3075607 RepID=A0ABU2YL29_9FLAO|nr:M12 family metallo-peptidase [Ichthyenterobacterium sp. W332]MDT0558404.1 M12 family metallo-peptidase [Ichthyenterobacterium sp. W332]